MAKNHLIGVFTWLILMGLCYLMFQDYLPSAKRLLVMGACMVGSGLMALVVGVMFRKSKN